MKRTTDEIERASNRFLEEKLEELYQVKDLKLRPYSLHALKEKGIDFIFEIEERSIPTTSEPGRLFSKEPYPHGSFYVQTKGQDSLVKILVSGDNKGLISFQLKKYNHIKYFCQEVDHPMIIVLCDLKKMDIYWLSIQLESSKYLQIYKQAQAEHASGKRKSESVQIYFNPENLLCKQNNLQYENCEHFLEDIKESRELIFRRVLSFNHLKFQKKYKDDLSKPLLDRVYIFFETIFGEINYYPVHKFVTVLPFRSEEESSPYYRSSSFSLHTDSDELFRFFDSMNVMSNSVTFKNKEFTDGVQEPERKGKEILQRLTNNLIFEISSERQFINVRFRGHEDCDCERCSFNRFRFVKAIQKLETAPTSMEEKFRLAYYQYKLGDLIGAAISFQKLAKETKGKEHIRYYIASFNQTKLARFIRNRYFVDDEPNELLSELDLVNLDDIYQEIRKHDDLGIIKFIYDQSYFLESQQSISSIIEKLRDRFEQQKRGGFSSHSDGWELMNRYLQIYSFLTGNYVIYDEFSEFKNLTNQVIEGVFASYATDETPSGRIVALDDFWVNVIIKYGDATKIKKFSRRYELKSLEYQMSSADGISIFDSFTTFLSQAADLPNELLKNKNKVFAEKYNDYFTNFLTLFGLIEVEDGTLKEVRNELIKFLKNERFLYPNRLSAILFFISAKANQQDVAFIKEMLFMVLKGEGILRRDALQAISSHILDHYDGLTFTDKESEELIQLIKNHIVEHGSSFHLESLVPLGKAVTNKDISLSISAIISDKLDESFLVNLYYLAIMYDVIPNKDDWFRKFRKFSEPDLNRASSVRAFLGGPDNNRYSHINEFINLCYKLGIDMREFNEFNDVDPFYDWLLDLAGFDYTHFEPKWVKEYPTKHYFDEFRKHNIIRENLNRYLSENRDEKIAQVYFDLYASEATV